MNDGLHYIEQDMNGDWIPDTIRQLEEHLELVARFEAFLENRETISDLGGLKNL